MGALDVEKVKLLNRLKRIKGQVAAIERAVDDEKAFAHVIQQATACRGAIDGFIAELVEDHIRTTFVDASRPETDPRTKAADELVKILHSYLT